MNYSQYIIYHSPCPDGAVAAWWYVKSLHPDIQHDLINYKRSSRERVNSVALYPSHPAKIPEDIETFRNSKLVFIDMCWNEEMMRKLLEVTSDILIYDHHITTQRIVANIPEFNNSQNVIIEQTRSAAGIMLDRVKWYNNETPSLMAQQICRYVEDKDIWKWELENSEYVNTALDIENICYDIYHVDRCAKYGNLNDLVASGKMYIKYRDYQIDRIIRNAEIRHIAIDDKLYTVSVVNSSILQSEIGGKILNGSNEKIEPDFVFIWHSNGGISYVSLRGKDPNIDLSVIAAKIKGVLYGGGHPRASGCKISGDIEQCFLGRDLLSIE